MRVPVLSVQITVVDPKVSTAFILRIMALCRAMLRIPIASVVTRIIGNPSGTIATKIAIATRNWNFASFHKSPPSTYSRINPIETINAATIRAMKPRNLPKDSNLCSNGVLGVSASAMSLAIFPSSVFIPVAVTIPTALPVEIVVPM